MSLQTLVLILALGAAGTVCLAQDPQMPRPRLQRVEVTGPDVMRLTTDLRRVNDDPQRSYWIIGPTSRSPRRTFQFTDRPRTTPKPVLPATTAPGLLVVLTADASDYSQRQFWLEIAQNALRGHYFVALPVVPKGSGNSPSVWTANSMRSQGSKASFTTENFAAEVVKDVTGNYNINPEHIYLHGAADSGPAVYACALEEQTPFKGFYILASIFKSAQLPPLSRAKNRRLFLQHSQEDKVTPYWMAAAAQKLLAGQGAAVKLAIYHGEHGYGAADSTTARMTEAIAWLEGIK